MSKLDKKELKNYEVDKKVALSQALMKVKFGTIELSEYKNLIEYYKNTDKERGIEFDYSHWEKA